MPAPTLTAWSNGRLATINQLLVAFAERGLFLAAIRVYEGIAWTFRRDGCLRNVEFRILWIVGDTEIPRAVAASSGSIWSHRVRPKIRSW